MKLDSKISMTSLSIFILTLSIAALLILKPSKTGNLELKADELKVGLNINEVIRQMELHPDNVYANYKENSNYKLKFNYYYKSTEISLYFNDSLLLSKKSIDYD